MKYSRTTSIAVLGTVAAIVAAGGVELVPGPLPCDRPRRRPSGPPNRAREEARRRKQMAAREHAAARKRCSAGEHRAAGENMPGACADCGADWADLGNGGRAEEGGAS